MKNIATLLAVATKDCFGRMFRTRRLLKGVVLYALFDLFIGGFCGGVLPLSLLQPQARAQNPQFANNMGGRYMASEYGKWFVHNLNTIASGATSMNLDNCFVSVGTGNKKIFPIAVNVPVTVIDGSLTETALAVTSIVAPGAASGSSAGPNPFNCSFGATFATHTTPE